MNFFPFFPFFLSCPFVSTPLRVFFQYAVHDGTFSIRQLQKPFPLLCYSLGPNLVLLPSDVCVSLESLPLKASFCEKLLSSPRSLFSSASFTDKPIFFFPT